MNALEKKVINGLLILIRARREERRVPRVKQAPVASSTAGASAKLREASFSDYEAVTELKRRWGLVPDSYENWERLWRHNPALEQTQADRPIGWVLEADGKLVGYLGNISLLYRYGDRTLTTVASSGLVVEPAYRAVSLSLVAAFYRQKSVDLYVATTAIEAVGKIARAFKSDPLPQPDYETVLFWVLRSFPFSRALMEKLEIRSALSHMGSVLASLAVGTDKIARIRWPRSGSTRFAMSEINVDEIGIDFQVLWTEKLNEGLRLFADRRPAVLQWHFRILGDRGTTRVLCCRHNGELLGYAVVRSDQGQVNGPRRSLIADMLVKRDDPEIINALLVAAYAHAKRMGSHMLEVLGLPDSIRKVCVQWNPYSRKYPACPFFYRASDPVLHKELSDGMAWYATPFDGDTTLMP